MVYGGYGRFTKPFYKNFEKKRKNIKKYIASLHTLHIP